MSKLNFIESDSIIIAGALNIKWNEVELSAPISLIVQGEKTIATPYAEGTNFVGILKSIQVYGNASVVTIAPIKIGNSYTVRYSGDLSLGDYLAPNISKAFEKADIGSLKAYATDEAKKVATCIGIIYNNSGDYNALKNKPTLNGVDLVIGSTIDGTQIFTDATGTKSISNEIQTLKEAISLLSIEVINDNTGAYIKHGDGRLEAYVYGASGVITFTVPFVGDLAALTNTVKVGSVIGTSGVIQGYANSTYNYYAKNLTLTSVSVSHRSINGNSNNIVTLSLCGYWK